MGWRCPDCGQICMTPVKPENHRCNEENYIKYQARLFESAWKTFLSSPKGRFATYCAKRQIARDSTAS